MKIIRLCRRCGVDISGTSGRRIACQPCRVMELREYNRQWRRENPDKVKASYHRTSERRNRWARAYYQKNVARIKYRRYLREEEKACLTKFGVSF